MTDLRSPFECSARTRGYPLPLISLSTIFFLFSFFSLSFPPRKKEKEKKDKKRRENPHPKKARGGRGGWESGSFETKYKRHWLWKVNFNIDISYSAVFFTNSNKTWNSEIIIRGGRTRNRNRSKRGEGGESEDTEGVKTGPNERKRERGGMVAEKKRRRRIWNREVSSFGKVINMKLRVEIWRINATVLNLFPDNKDFNVFKNYSLCKQWRPHSVKKKKKGKSRGRLSDKAFAFCDWSTLLTG